jgi:hypothetical protein
MILAEREPTSAQVIAAVIFLLRESLRSSGSFLDRAKNEHT